MMKRKLTDVLFVVSILIVVSITACSALSKPTSPMVAEATVTPLIPEPKPTDRVPPDKTYYRKRCWPACHYDPTWVSEDPAQITLDFDTGLGEGWSWVNGDPPQWTVDDLSGVLRVMAYPGADTEHTEHILVREAPSGYFDVVTQVTFDPAVDDQEAGIFIQLEGGEIISLSRGLCREGEDPSCVGQGVYFDGREADCQRTGVETSAETVNLMLREAGGSFVGYYSLGEDLSPEAPWVEVGRCYVSGAHPTNVGLVVKDGGPAEGPSCPADFELVTLVDRK